MMKFTVVIPARYASTRFPGKPLARLGDRTILQRVYERARYSQAERVIIATDDERIAKAATDFGAEVCMTSDQHKSGTERLAEVVAQQSLSDETVIVNLQGDEPFIGIDTINQVAGLLLDSPDHGMATLCHVLASKEEITDPHIVKVVLDSNSDALYFSRAPIPWDRDQLCCIPCYRHIGLYAYTAKFLRDYIRMEPCELEKAEALEQLRVLYHGYKIKVGITEEELAIGIDTPEDLERAKKILVPRAD